MFIFPIRQNVLNLLCLRTLGYFLYTYRECVPTQCPNFHQFFLLHLLSLVLSYTPLIWYWKLNWTPWERSLPHQLKTSVHKSKDASVLQWQGHFLVLRSNWFNGSIGYLSSTLWPDYWAFWQSVLQPFQTVFQNKFYCQHPLPPLMKIRMNTKLTITIPRPEWISTHAHCWLTSWLYLPTPCLSIFYFVMPKPLSWLNICFLTQLLTFHS